MKKSPISLRRITIATIKRKVSKPHDWNYTQYYEEETAEDLGVIQMELQLEEDELPIASIIRSAENWTFVTTHRVIGKLEGKRQKIEITAIEKSKWWHLKHLQKHVTHTFQLEDKIGKQYRFIVENKGFMVIVLAISVLRQVTIHSFSMNTE